jgi:hypothetical protein
LNAKNAKTTFSFNVFLASIAGEPLGIKYTQIANILNVSQSTISKLRHGRLQKMPPGLEPDMMASRFGEEIVKGFAPTKSTVAQFKTYAQMLKDKYLFSDILNGFVSLFITATPTNEQRMEKFYSGMIPALIKRCYEEAYSNSEKDYSNWVETHKNEQTEILYQRICDTINQDVFDDEKLKQLLNVVYSASLRQQYKLPYSDLSFIKMLNEYVGSHVNHPFYNSVRRSEIISISEDSTVMKRSIKAQEQIMSPSPNLLRYTLNQTFYHANKMAPDEIVKHAFGNLNCMVNGVPLVRYMNVHEHNEYTSPEQFVTAIKMEDEISGLISTELLFAFNLYPEKLGETFEIAYEYCSTTTFIPNISCNYSYTLRYPCKFLEHEFSLDAKTRDNWGVRVKLFTPLTDSAYGTKIADQYTKNSGTADCRHVTFYEWAMPGSGYYRNIYELKFAGSQYGSNFN